MVRLVNYLLIVVLLLLPAFDRIGNGFLQFAVSLVMCLSVIWFLGNMTFDDNLGVLSFMVCLPFVLYLSDLPTVNSTLPLFLGTIFLSVSLPFVFWFLFRQLAQPLEG